MSNNFKVNAKTKPLELKKKHNLLVEKVEDMEEEIPNSQTITNLANQAIQADKEILSKIEITYDSDNNLTILKFPDYVLPLKMELNDGDLDGDLFFNYNTSKGIDSNGNNLYNLSNVNNHYELSKTGNIVSDIDIYCLSFIYYNGYDGLMNTLNLYLPSYLCDGDGNQLKMPEDLAKLCEDYFLYNVSVSFNEDNHSIKIEDIADGFIPLYIILNVSHGNSTEKLTIYFNLSTGSMACNASDWYIDAYEINMGGRYISIEDISQTLSDVSVEIESVMIIPSNLELEL